MNFQSLKLSYVVKNVYILVLHEIIRLESNTKISNKTIVIYGYPGLVF